MGTVHGQHHVALLQARGGAQGFVEIVRHHGLALHEAHLHRRVQRAPIGGQDFIAAINIGVGVVNAGDDGQRRQPVLLVGAGGGKLRNKLRQHPLPVFPDGVAIGKKIRNHVPVAVEGQQAQAGIGRGGRAVGLFVQKQRVADVGGTAHVVVRALVAVVAQVHQLLAQRGTELALVGEPGQVGRQAHVGGLGLAAGGAGRHCSQAGEPGTEHGAALVFRFSIEHFGQHTQHFRVPVVVAAGHGGVVVLHKAPDPAQHGEVINLRLGEVVERNARAVAESGVLLGSVVRHGFGLGIGQGLPVHRQGQLVHPHRAQARQ